MLPVEQPFKTYTGLDGKPLDNGYVYFGQPHQDPANVSKRVTVYWDAAGTLPAYQPLRTVNGYIVNDSGAPANVFFDGAYSELVRDSKMRQVFYARTSDEFSIAAVVSNFINGLTAAGGSDVIGFIQAAAGAVKRTVLGKLGDKVNVRDFGAVLDGVTNDSAALQAADNYATTKGKAVEIDGPALIKSPLRVGAPWVGVKGSAKIIIAKDFAYVAGVGAGIGAIVNKNFALQYSAATADYFFFENIDISLEQTGGASGSAIVLANIKGGLIDGVNAATNSTTAVCGSLLDLYACVKDVVVRRSSFDNLTQAAGGGGAAWVRNITSDGSVASNVTEGITIDEGCRFTTTTLDEALAVYGVRGKTRNVTIRRTYIVGAASPVKHGTLASAFPLNDGSVSGATAAVEGVLWDDCDFIDANFNDHVLRIGRSEDVAQQCENVKVRNSRFKVGQSAVRTSYVVRVIKSVGDGNTVESCHINAVGSAQPITYGIGGADRATGNTVTGNLTYAAYSCKLVDGNPLFSAANGTFNCRDVRGNRIFATSIGCVQNETAVYNIEANYIEVAASGTAGVFYNTLGNATAPAGDITGNAIIVGNANAFAVQCSGSAPGPLRALNNKVSGTGKTISGKFAVIDGNDWYGKQDAIRSAPYIDYDHNYSTPIGTRCRNSAPVVTTNSVQGEWQKVANNGNATDWKALYSSLVSS